MDFKKATDELFANVSHDDLAKALGVSVASIRQARLQEGALARRSPPPGWQISIRRLAEGQERHYRRLAQKMRNLS